MNDYTTLLARPWLQAIDEITFDFPSPILDAD
jgi:hypothetical protein